MSRLRGRGLTPLVALVATVGAVALPGQAGAADVPIQIVDFRFAAEDRMRDWAGYSGIDLGWVPLRTPDDPSDDDPPDLTQAGAHPNLNLAIYFCDPVYSHTPTCYSNPQDPPVHEQLDDWIVRTPPGLLGNPLALPRCPYEVFRDNECPDETIVGYSRARANLVSPAFHREAFVIIFNVEPTGSELARFGAVAYPDGAPTGLEPLVFQDTLFTIRSDGDFGLDSTSPDFFRVLGTPPSAIPSKQDWIEVSLFGYTGNDPVGGTPFITNPTACDPNLKVATEVDSYQNDGNFVTTFPNGSPASVPYPVEGCENVPFNPKIEVDRETSQAGAPSGYTVSISFPDYDEEAPIYESHLKDAVVEMPEGVALAAPAAEGLEGCTDAQFGKGNNESIRCPAGSQVGTVSVETPVLDARPQTPDVLDPLSGKVYFAKPTAQDPWRIFIGIEDANLRIKLEGDVELDEQTGQITTTFLDNPPTPFTRFDFTLNGGDRAVLQNPVECANHTLKARFTPWSDVDPTPHPDRTVERTASFDTSGCPSPRPFSPTATGSTSPTQAGAYTTSRLGVTRPDGHQLIRKMDLALPPGLVGSLAAVALCEADQAHAGSCPASSKIGTVKASVGSGGAPIGVGGEIFLTKPLAAGDAAGLSIVVPAKTGPIDLGTVVTTSRVVLRQSDGGINVHTSDLPKIFKGIHLPVRRIDVLVDRQGFFQNPTSCAPLTLSLDFTSHGEARAGAAITDSATGCEALAFSPRLEMSISGETKKDGHPELRAVVTQDPGQSGIRRAEVLLPQILRPDVPVLNRPGKLCAQAQLEAGACPARSIVGEAKVWTPLLPEPLSGPAYIVQDLASGSPLPKLVIKFSGLVSIDLVASNSIQGVRTFNVFDQIPDVPQSRFELTVQGGPEGILKNFADACTVQDHADASFFGHSGASFSERPELRVEGCKVAQKALRIRGLSVKGKSARVSLQCLKPDAPCAGRLSLRSRKAIRPKRGAKRRKLALSKAKSFSIPAGRTRTVTLPLTKTGRLALRRSRRLALEVSVRIDGDLERRSFSVGGK